MYRILVADDEPDILSSVKKRLEREGYFVFTASDGQAALDIAESESCPDVIVLDILMPNKNGFEILRELRSKPKNKYQPVIIVSAQNDFDDIKKGYDLEADFYITKPFTLGQLTKGIETMLSIIPLRKKD